MPSCHAISIGDANSNVGRRALSGKSGGGEGGDVWEEMFGSIRRNKLAPAELSTLTSTYENRMHIHIIWPKSSLLSLGARVGSYCRRVTGHRLRN